MSESQNNEDNKNVTAEDKPKKRFSIDFLYDRNTLTSDLSAGVTIGIESIPTALVSAVLAGLNPVHGLYAVLLATPIGALFASSAYMTVQTTSAMSLVVASVPATQFGRDSLSSLLALTILTGIIMLVAGLFKLGSLFRFVPNAVMTGFVNGIAVLIILGQLGTLTDYSSSKDNSVAQAIDLWLNRDSINTEALAVGIATILLLLFLEQTAVRKFSMFFALLLASLLVPLFNWYSVELVSDIAPVPAALPTLIIPPPSAFLGMFIPALSLAFVGLVQGAAVSKSYVNPDGEYPNVSGDFVGQGAANIAAGLFQGMPVSGSLSATSMAINNGAKTRMSNILTGVIIAAALLFFTDFINALAMPALAGLLIVIGFRTLSPADVRMVWKTSLVQQVVMVFTFTATLFIPLQYAVFFGVALAIILFVIQQSNKIVIKEMEFAPAGQVREVDPPEYLAPNDITILMPFGSLFFAATAAFEDQLPKITDETHRAVVILYLHGRTDLDSTFLDLLERYVSELEQNDSKLMLSDVEPLVKEQFEKTGLIDVFGWENVFTSTDILGESTRKAYHDAQKWIDETLERSK